jgi:hypothetical protein
VDAKNRVKINLAKTHPDHFKNVLERFCQRSALKMGVWARPSGTEAPYRNLVDKTDPLRAFPALRRSLIAPSV